MNTDINDTLLRHLATKGRAANPKQYLKDFRTKLAKRLPEYSRVLEIEFH